MEKSIPSGHEFTIKHYFDPETASYPETKVVLKPSLGRMDLSKSLNPLCGFDKILNWVKKAPLVYLPLFACPATAMAAIQ